MKNILMIAACLTVTNYVQGMTKSKVLAAAAQTLMVPVVSQKYLTPAQQTEKDRQAKQATKHAAQRRAQERAAKSSPEEISEGELILNIKS